MIFDGYSYIDEMPNLFKGLIMAKEVDIVHQKTCPVCGRTLVNLYRKKQEWKCARCWKQEDTADEG